jgi:hypothetical protein
MSKGAPAADRNASLVMFAWRQRPEKYLNPPILGKPRSLPSHARMSCGSVGFARLSSAGSAPASKRASRAWSHNERDHDERGSS